MTACFRNAPISASVCTLLLPLRSESPLFVCVCVCPELQGEIFFAVPSPQLQWRFPGKNLELKLISVNEQDFCPVEDNRRRRKGREADTREKELHFYHQSPVNFSGVGWLLSLEDQRFIECRSCKSLRSLGNSTKP